VEGVKGKKEVTITTHIVLLHCHCERPKGARQSRCK
jgi:hypothetical protein